VPESTSKLVISPLVLSHDITFCIFLSSCMRSLSMRSKSRRFFLDLTHSPISKKRCLKDLSNLLSGQRRICTLSITMQTTLYYTFTLLMYPIFSLLHCFLSFSKPDFRTNSIATIISVDDRRKVRNLQSKQTARNLGRNNRDIHDINFIRSHLTFLTSPSIPIYIALTSDYNHFKHNYKHVLDALNRPSSFFP
jgi:hypothetical protein